MKPNPEVTKFLREAGSRGGQSKSDEKIAAVTRNLEKARKMRELYRRNPGLRELKYGNHNQE